MYRVTAALRLIVHSPRGINFSLSADDAVRNIQDKYSKRWFGAQLDFLELSTTSKEFLPFYFCSGRVHGTFTGTVSYSQAGRDDGRGHSTGSSSTHVNTAPQQLDSVFEENQTQIYAGYKYNMNYVHYALENEANPINMKKMNLVDTTGATINLFEQSTMTLKEMLEKDVRRQATATAESIIRSFHPGASTISVSFSDLSIKIDEVTPCFVPCYVVKAQYDNQQYTLYVNGMLGTVGGPYLLNALYVARTTALSTITLGLLLTPNKVAGFLFGSLVSVATYYLAFYAAKLFPRYRRDRNRRERESMRQQHQGGDKSGFRPTSGSSRTQAEYEQSSYWDSHPFQRKQRRTTFSSGSSSGSSSSSCGWSAGSEGSSSGSDTSGRQILRDPQGYYKTLGLRGDESVNEIRSAYRQQALKQHPDVGGSTAEMTRINEAYRVLRDPTRRVEYDNF